MQINTDLVCGLISSGCLSDFTTLRMNQDYSRRQLHATIFLLMLLILLLILILILILIHRPAPPRLELPRSRRKR